MLGKIIDKKRVTKYVFIVLLALAMVLFVGPAGFVYAVDTKGVFIGSPSNFKVEPISPCEIKVTWKEVTASKVRGYILAYKESSDPEPSWCEVEVRYKNTVQYIISGLIPNTRYSVKIRCDSMDPSDSTPFSDIVICKTLQYEMATPFDLTEQVTGKTIKLNWQVSFQDPGGLFVVERSIDAEEFSQVAETGNTNFTDSNLLWNTVYYYRVAQKNVEGELSDYSDPIQVTTNPVPVPTNVSVVLEDYLTVSWDPVDNISGYIIEKSADGSTWETFATVSTNSYSAYISGSTAEGYYRVISDGGNDQFSQPSLEVVLQKPLIEPSLTYRITNKNVELSWDHQVASDGYRVYLDGDLVAELPGEETHYGFTGERGATYTVEVEAFNENELVSTVVNIKIFNMPTPGRSIMARDIAKHVGATTAAMGSLLALGFALQSSGKLTGLFKLLFRR